MRRFTPTPVGKTSEFIEERLHEKVHPHACGENDSTVITPVGDMGSPPRLWGKP